MDPDDFFRGLNRRIQDLIAHPVDSRHFKIIFFAIQDAVIQQFWEFLQHSLINLAVSFLRKILQPVGSDHFTLVKVDDINPSRDLIQVLSGVQVQKQVYLVVLWWDIFKKGHQHFFGATMAQRTDADKYFFLQCLSLIFNNAGSPRVADTKTNDHHKIALV